MINKKEQAEKTITAEEWHKILKLIKIIDFKVVDQLGKTPSKISILSCCSIQKLTESLF